MLIKSSTFTKIKITTVVRYQIFQRIQQILSWNEYKRYTVSNQANTKLGMAEIIAKDELGSKLKFKAGKGPYLGF